MQPDKKKTRTKPQNITPEILNDRLNAKYAYLYAKPSRKKRMDTRTVSQMQSFIESKMEEPNGNILDDNFIANFRLLKEVDATVFESMTKTLFKVLLSRQNDNDFVNKLTTEWLEYANRQSMEVKERFFLENWNIFQELAKLIPKIGSFSLQAKILKIIIGHHKAPHEYIQILFKPLIDDSRHDIFKRFESYNKLSDRQKHTIMYRDLQNELNRSGNKVYSKVIRYMYFDGKAVEVYPKHEGFSDWNLTTKNIEFSINVDGNEAKTIIDIDNLKSLHYEVCQHTNEVREITFKLSELMSFNCESNPRLSSKQSIQKIMMVFYLFKSDDLDTLIMEMFPSLVVVKKNGKVDVLKPTLNSIQTSHLGEVFISTPPTSPSRPVQPGIRDDLSEFFQNTQYSQNEVIYRPNEVLNHSVSETENKMMNDKPNQEPHIQIQPAEKPSTQKSSSQKPVPNDANNNVANNGKKKKEKAKIIVDCKLETEGGFATVIRNANEARTNSKKVTPTIDLVGNMGFDDIVVKKEMDDIVVKKEMVDVVVKKEKDDIVIKKEPFLEDEVIVIEDEPKRTRSRTAARLAEQKSFFKSIPDKPKRSYKRKTTAAKTNVEIITLNVSPDSTTIQRKSNKALNPAKRIRLFEPFEFKGSEDETTNLPDPPQNTAEDFNSLFTGPSCFKGQFKPNVKDLHQKLVSQTKTDRSNQITYISDDSD